MSCCCDADVCVICSDNFNRGDSSDISTGSDCGWTEQSGAWEILSNRLRVTSAGIATSDTNASGLPSLYISVKVRADTAGDDARVLVNYEDTSNYDFVEVTFSATVGQLRLVEVIAGTPTQLAATSANLNVALNTDHDLIVCLRDGDFAAQLTHGVTTTKLNTELDGVTDTKAGLASGTTTGNVEFDDWSLEKNGLISSGCSDCDIDCVSCSSCISSKASDQYQLVLRDVKNERELGVDPDNAQCANCTSVLSGVFIVDHVSSCDYDFEISDSPCRSTPPPGGQTIALNLDDTADTIKVTLTYYVTDNRSHTVTFSRTVSGGVDCMNLRLFSVPFLSDDGNGASGCDFSDAFVQVSTLDCT